MKQRLPLQSSLLTLALLFSACTVTPTLPTPTAPAAQPPAATQVVTTTTTVTTTTVTTTVPGSVTATLPSTEATSPTLTTTAALTPTLAVTGATPLTSTAILTPTPVPAPITSTGGITSSAVVTGVQLISPTNSAATIMQVISSTPQLQQLAVILTTSGMAQALQSPGTYTVFAPTDQAFANLPREQLTATLNNATALTNLVKYHVVVDQVTAAQLASLGVALSSTGQPITITVQSDSSLTANTALIIQSDVQASNGLIHIIDQVLTPPSQ